MKKKVDVVIPYILTGDNGKELMYVLRSIEKNLKAEPVVWLMGDKPDWITNVKHVKVERVQGMDYMSFLDTANKIKEACQQEEIGSGFVYMYDDTFFISETTLKDIQEYKALENLADIKQWFKNTTASKKWCNLLAKTAEQLKSEGLQIFNYETHTPRYYNKIKALKLYEKYNMATEPYQFATMYYNNYNSNVPRLLLPRGDDIKLGIYRQFTYDVLKKKLRDNKFLNYSAMCYTDDMRRLLEDLFPEKSKYEL